MTNVKTRRSHHTSEEDENERKFLLFFAGGELYGTKITDVREVIAPQTPKPVADTKPWVKGIINLRGEVLVAVDLRNRFLATELPSKAYMVIETDRGSMALIVDRIHAVQSYQRDQIHDRTQLRVNVKNEHFVGVGQQGSETAVLLDLRRVFNEEDLITIDNRPKVA